MIDEATKGKHCNASCCDYYCPQNVSGRCQAPNKCLGVEEAAELMAELEATKREIAALRKRERGDCAKLREALLQVIRSMELESGHMCTEKKLLGMHGQTQEDLCKGCRARNDECWTMTLKRECEAALAAISSEVPSNEDKLREDIKDLHRQLESMTLQRDQTFELFRRTVARDYAEWRVVVKVKGRWLVSPHVFPGMSRQAALDFAKSDRVRYEDARPQIRICSAWSDADVCPIEEGETDGSK